MPRSRARRRNGRNELARRRLQPIAPPACGRAPAELFVQLRAGHPVDRLAPVLRRQRLPADELPVMLRVHAKAMLRVPEPEMVQPGRTPFGPGAE